MTSPVWLEAGLRTTKVILESGGTLQGFTRSKFDQESLSKFPIPLTAWRKTGTSFNTVLGAASGSDLGLSGGAFASRFPIITTSDAKGATVTQMARVQVMLPSNYDSGADIGIRLFAGMLTTISDGTATIDLSAYKADGTDGSVGGVGSDLVTTAAQSINSITPAAKDFAVDGSGMNPGDWLDIQVTIAITDSITATAVLGIIGLAWLLCDTKG